VKTFELGYGVNLKAAAEATEMAWQLATHGVRPLEQLRAPDGGQR
jgi:hypothetical protein